jgi:tocopherol O-methyltransferase
MRRLLEPICRQGTIPHLLTAPELIAQAENAGLVSDICEDLTDKDWRTWSIVVWRLVRRLSSNASYRAFLFDAAAEIACLR